MKLLIGIAAAVVCALIVWLLGWGALGWILLAFVALPLGLVIIGALGILDDHTARRLRGAARALRADADRPPRLDPAST